MARSITYWYDYLIAEKNTMAQLNALQPSIDNTQTLLTDLKSTSRVARWRLIFWVVATGYYAIDVLFDLFKIELLAVLEKSKFGTLPWYISKAKAFQLGDALVTVKLFTDYATVDESAQIVKLASAQAAEGRISLKIAKLVSNVPTPLSSLEFAAFKAYMQAVKPPTVNIDYINAAADQLQLTLDVVYDANLLSATGELLSTPGTYPLNDKVDEYLKSFASEAGFNSYYELMRAQDVMQQSTGVVSVYIVNAKARDGSNPFTTFTQRYNPKSGHIIIDPSTPITVTYTANV